MLMREVGRAGITLRDISALRVTSHSCTKRSYEHKLSIFELDVIFELIAPEIFQEQGQKPDKNYQKITLDVWERNLSLVPG